LVSLIAAAEQGWIVDCPNCIFGAMAKTTPEFVPEMIKSGRWFVSVKTGNGPDSHIGDFETEADAKKWIATKSQYWPGKPDAPN
jgi:hypothetical protein